MKNIDDIVIILDSVLDDYYFLWECYSEYSQIKKQPENLLSTFSQLLKEAFDLKYLDFYEGVNFDGDEVLIADFQLNDSAIEKLLDWKNIPNPEIRVRTSKSGFAFLNQYNNR